MVQTLNLVQKRGSLRVISKWSTHIPQLIMINWAT